MEDKEEKNKIYIIPHNYKNNGRILNMFEREQIKKMLYCVVPITLLLIVLPFPMTVKAFLGVFLIGLPASVFLFELDQIMVDRFAFNKNRRIYYSNAGRYLYEVEKKKEVTGRKRVKS